MQTTTLLGWRAVGAAAPAADPARGAVVSRLATMLWGDRSLSESVDVSRSFDDSDDVTGRPSANAILTDRAQLQVADYPGVTWRRGQNL